MWIAEQLKYLAMTAHLSFAVKLTFLLTMSTELQFVTDVSLQAGEHQLWQSTLRKYSEFIGVYDMWCDMSSWMVNLRK